MATITDLAQSVVNELNTGEFSLEFTAVSTLLPSYELKELKTLKVTVVPRSQVFQRANRAQTAREVEIDIGIQKKFSGDSEAGPLLDLVDEIANHFDGKRPTTMPSAICSKVVNEPIYAPEHIEQYRQFTSVLTLTFKVS
ncbi:MAG: hypothetical protein PVH19_15510 [Planctomycetia bacterium]|jgi:hypothetical protein